VTVAGPVHSGANRLHLLPVFNKRPGEVADERHDSRASASTCVPFGTSWDQDEDSDQTLGSSSIVKVASTESRKRRAPMIIPGRLASSFSCQATVSSCQ
jgi:hypothetical protein